MRITSKGQVTIPIDIRQELGLHPGDEVEFVIDEDAVRIFKSHKNISRGQRIVEQLRSHRSDFDMTTDEIMALTRGE